MITQQMVDSVCLQIQNLIIERNDALELIQQQDERIAKLEAALAEEKRLSDAISRDCNNTALERNKAAAERDALKANAERYQRVRKMASRGELPREWTEGYTESELDAPIDAAKGE